MRFDRNTVTHVKGVNRRVDRYHYAGRLVTQNVWLRYSPWANAAVLPEMYIRTIIVSFEGRQS